MVNQLDVDWPKGGQRFIEILSDIYVSLKISEIYRRTLSPIFCCVGGVDREVIGHLCSLVQVLSKEIPP